jgi:hypothetical protein
LKSKPAAEYKRWRPDYIRKKNLQAAATRMALRRFNSLNRDKVGLPGGHRCHVRIIIRRNNAT